MSEIYKTHTKIFYKNSKLNHKNYLTKSLKINYDFEIKDVVNKIDQINQNFRSEIKNKINLEENDMFDIEN